MYYLNNLILAQYAGEESFNWLPLVVFGVTGVVALVGMFKGWKWLRSKLDELFDFFASKTKLQFLANVDEVLVGFAVDLYDSQIKHLKAEGRWNDTTGGEMLDILKGKAKDHFGFDSLARLAGGGSPEEVDAFVKSRAETAVKRSKLLTGDNPKVPKPDPSKA